MSFPFLLYFFEWQLQLWSVICLSLDRISTSQLCSLKWFKIAFELWGGGHGQRSPRRAFSMVSIPKWHSNMLVTLPRYSRILSPLLNLQMFIFCSVRPSGQIAKLPQPIFLSLPLYKFLFSIEHLVYLCSWPVRAVYGVYLLANNWMKSCQSIY